MEVICISEAYIGGSRRRVGDKFTIDPEDFIDPLDGVTLLLPKCIVPAGGEAQAMLEEIRSRPLRAAVASAGTRAEIHTSQDPRERLPGFIAGFVDQPHKGGSKK